MDLIGRVASVGEALENVMALTEAVAATIDSPFPQFGFWFRGQINSTWELTPSVWLKGTQYDEGSMGAHFRLLRPEHDATHGTDFEWLTLMQHFGLPTRLLDWTENLLVGLFFAAWREGGSLDERRRELGSDGALYVLSARKLNTLVTGRPNIAVPTGFHPVARAILSRSNNRDEWIDQFSTVPHSKASVGADLYDAAIDKKSPKAREVRERLLSAPVAVFPSRRNERLVAQAGVFTIHGGKQPSVTATAPAAEPLPEPTSLFSLNATCARSEQFLWKFVVTNKKRVLEELEHVGVHQGTLFPDLPHQAQFIRRRWDGAGR